MPEQPHRTGSIAARVSAAWAAVLGGSDPHAAPPDPQARFLAAGGHSLAAARLIARLGRELCVELPMSAILRDDPSLAELVDVVAGQVAGGTGTASGPADAPVPPPDGAVAPAPAGAARSAPLAPTMRRVWTWHRLHPDSPAYNVVRVLRIDGRLQPATLRAALGDLSARHEALRCAVVEHRRGAPEVVVDDPVAVPLSVDVVRPADGDTMAAVDRALYRVAGQPFRMASPPLWRVGLVWVPALGHSWLVLAMHHLISDMRAADVVFADLAQAYRAREEGRAPRFAGPAPSLLAHLDAERRLVATPRWEQDLAWWSRRLSGMGAATTLPLATADPDGRTHAACTRTAELPADASDAMDLTLRTQGLTPALLFLTAANHVLGAWIGQDRAEVVGLPSVRMNRPDDERLVGFLLDTLLLRLSSDPRQTFAHAYRAVRDAFADAADHALPAYDDIMERLRLPRGPGTGSPLIRLWFNDMTQAAPPPSLGGHPAAEYDLPPAWALFDLSLYLRRGPAGYRLHLVTPRGSAEPADMVALAGQIMRTAMRAAADSQRPLGDLLEPPTGRDAPAGRAGGPAGGHSTVDLLRRHATERPTAVAVSDRHGALDYRTLDAQVDELAAALPAGVRAVVAVPARRDRRFVARLLACWRAGATAVLVDAQWPPWRRRRALEVAAATHAFDWSGDGPATPVADHAGRSPAGEVPAPARDPDAAAHVLFTSGSTGDPLAVHTTTALAEAALTDLADRYGVSAADRVAMLSGPAHDPVLRDLGLPLRAGGTLCVPPPELFGDPAALASWLRRERVTILNATPAMLALVCGVDPRPLPDLRVVVCGGSPLSAATARLIRSRAAGAVLVNGYGCTETPQLVVAHDLAPGQPVPPAGQVPIGRPLPGRRVRLRAPDGRRCDVGQLGELWVAAPHIADGYLDSDTDGRFTTDPDGTRWLRTGDLARRDAAGRLHLAGRRDRQVLVNGYRLALEEIESVARGCAGVTDAIAQVIDDGDRQAVRVWVQCPAGAPVTEGAVHAHLAAALPPGVVPARVLVVDRLELSENLKPVVPPREPVAAHAAAGGYPDSGLRELAESMLGRPLDPATNFFDAGFTSASLLQLSAELAELLGRPVDPLSLFDHPNLDALGGYLFGDRATPGQPVRALVRPRPAVRPEAPPPEPVPDRSDRLARMRANRRQARGWVQGSAASPGTDPQEPPATP